MPESKNRLERIDEEYRKELSQIISYELKNPNVTGMNKILNYINNHGYIE